MKKNYLMDGKKVRRCESNIAQMNVFEYIRHFGFTFSIDIQEYFKALAVAIIAPAMILFAPVTGIIDAQMRINSAKKTMKMLENP